MLQFIAGARGIEESHAGANGRMESDRGACALSGGGKRRDDAEFRRDA